MQNNDFEWQTLQLANRRVITSEDAGRRQQLL